MESVNAIGRRKKSVARVYLSEGKGNITVNKRTMKDYFPTANIQYEVMEPLNIIEALERFDIVANLNGGGFKGQAEAMRLAISRALIKIDPEWRPQLKAKGFLTRDARVVERKKPGRPKARKRFQFSKR